MLGFYVLLEDPDANVIIAQALLSALLQLGFLNITYAILLISPGHWQQVKTQQPIGIVGLVIISLSMSMSRPNETGMCVKLWRKAVTFIRFYSEKEVNR